MAMFGLVAVAGLKKVFYPGLTSRTMLIQAVSLLPGLVVILVPGALANVTLFLMPVFSSGLIRGPVAAILLNFALPEERA